MKYLSSMVVASAMLLAVVPALAKKPSTPTALNLSIAGANSGFNTVFGSTSRRGGSNTMYTGNAAAFSKVTVVGTTPGPGATNVSVAVSNTGVNTITGGGSNYMQTGNAVAGSSVTVVNLSNGFRH